MDDANVVLVQTVHSNMDGFTKREVKDAHAARKAQAMLGHPTNCKFLGMVCNNMITSCWKLSKLEVWHSAVWLLNTSYEDLWDSDNV